MQAEFYDDPRVLTMSLHESGRALFPGTGFPRETGGPGAEGTAVNVALPPGHRRRRLAACVPRRGAAADARRSTRRSSSPSRAATPTPTTRSRTSMLSVDGQRASYAALHELAHRFAGGRWVATGGGGYAWVYVVPRAWTHLLAEVVGRPVDPRRGGARVVAGATSHERLRAGCAAA